MSEWKEGAAQRRDERATKSEPEQRVGSKRKNTKRWCKGKVGREHTTVIELDPRWGDNQTCQREGWWPCRHRERCTTCEKVLHWFLPIEQCPTLSKADS